VVDFLQRAHEADERYTVRDGINVARYALKLLRRGAGGRDEALYQGIIMILGDEALPYLK
jgi:MoxR-like ATPase